MSYLDELYQRLPKKEELYLFLTRAYEALDECKKGAEIGEESLKKFSSLDLVLSVASDYACMGDYQSVKKLVEPLLKKHPKDPYVLNFIGYTYLELNIHLKKAGEFIKRALKLRPEDPYILDSMGWYFFKVGNLKEAERYLKKAIEKLPEPEAVIFEHLGDVYLSEGEKIKACKMYLKAVKASIHEIEKKRIRKKLEKACQEE